MEYWQLISNLATKAAWQLSAANEFGPLAQGVGGQAKGTDTIKSILANEFVCTERPQKGRQILVRPGVTILFW
jgi:hypothetical protein